MDSTASETKLIKVLRTILSFVLAIVISILSIAICFSAEFIDDSFIEKQFTSYEYVSAVQENYITYVQCVYEKNGFEPDNIDDIIRYDSVKAVAESYAGHYIVSRVGFDENTYFDLIDDIVSEIKKDIINQLDTANQNDSALEKTMNSIHDYFSSQIEIKGAAYFDTLFNVGKPVGYAAVGVGLFFFVFIALILFFLGERRFRSLRAISISFLTAGLFEICLAGIVLIISQVKRFDIYPIYLFNAFMKYVHSCIGIVFAAGIICIIISIILSTLTWMNKNRR